MSTAWTDETDSDYLDTVNLLQDEVARLEAELRRRDEAELNMPAEPRRDAAADDASARIGELTTLLAERDETIGVLCDQLAALEEVEGAKLAEWEQMDRWVRELEDRIERGGSPATEVDARLRRESEAFREQLEGRERAWEAERVRFEQEIAGLRSRLTEAAGRAGDRARAILEAENQQLRDDCRRLAAFEVECATIRERSSDLEEQLQQALCRVGHAEDEVRRQQFEHEAELTAVRASLASAKASAPAELSTDERIRAFRMHLQDVHEREEAQREERRHLANRISRLWRRR